MARTLSNAALTSMHAQETGQTWLVLVTISATSLPQPLRVVNNNEDITSRGNLYQAFPFDIILPGQDPDGTPKAILRFDNVDRTAIAAIRSVTAAPTVTLEVILASAPDTVEISFGGMSLRNVTYNAMSIEGELHVEPLLGEPITLNMTPSRFPGLFGIALAALSSMPIFRIITDGGLAWLA